MSLVTGHPDFDSLSRHNQLLSLAKDRVRQGYLETLWDHMDGDPTGYGNSTRYNPASSLTNTGSIIAGDEAGGSIILSSGATASSISRLAPANSIGATPWTVNTATAGKGFYLNAKFKITTTPDAQSKLFIGFTDGTNTLGVGIIGALSTTLFKLQHSANLATTGSTIGPVLDTSYHTVELWATGRDGNVYGNIDSTDGGTVTVTPTVTYSKLRLLCHCTNGTTAADQRLQLAHVFVAVEP